MTTSAFLRVIASCSMLALAVACGSGATPFEPSPALNVKIGAVMLAVGETFPLSNGEGLGPSVLKGAVWSSEHPDICAVDPDGNATARSVGAARITVSVEGRQRTIIVQVVPSIDGKWSGQVGFVSGRLLSGTGPVSYPRLPAASPYRLHASQIHDDITATDDGINTIRLTGNISHFGQMALAGAVSLSADDSEHVDRTWNGQLVAGELRATVIDTVRYRTFQGPQVVEYVWSIKLRRCSDQC